MKRVFDLFLASIGVVALSPVFVVLFILIRKDSKGGAFYLQKRVGRGGKEFNLIKFRTMHVNADKKGLLTVGNRDSRITRIGFYLRKYKVDELPQLFNVLLGNMSLVGPRPEVKKYTDLYTEDQKRVLTVKPGITDYASLFFINENEILEKEAFPEDAYLKKVLPEKLTLSLRYVDSQSLWVDLKIICLTLKKIIFP
ncbi:sugar transferase [Nafulsella turpanensis]|uniref:sugar transferase n=1 Tax=Nafulsella turpanensis TaxID=1265690 RepID=UPI00034AA6FC|nr:sugar transferase [Nafulsella turpanensis]